MTDTPPARIRRVRLPWWAWTLLVLALIVAVVAALGGFRDTPFRALPEVALGEPLSGETITTTVERVYVSSINPLSGYDAPEDEVFVVVEAVLENHSNAPSIFQRESLVVYLDGVIDAEFAYSVTDAVTGEPASFLQSGLEMPTVFTWTVSADEVSEGDEILVGLLDRYRDTENPIFNDAFTAPTAIARVVTTLEASTTEVSP